MGVVEPERGWGAGPGTEGANRAAVLCRLLSEKSRRPAWAPHDAASRVPHEFQKSLVQRVLVLNVSKVVAHGGSAPLRTPRDHTGRAGLPNPDRKAQVRGRRGVR